MSAARRYRLAGQISFGGAAARGGASDETPGPARRVWHDLLAEGLSCGLHRIERLMRVHGLKARPRRRGFAWRQYVRQRQETALRIAAEQHARELAYQDGLTGLPNRRQFDAALKEAIGSLPRAGAGHGLFLLDLNGFKQINDVHGHGVGDEVLTIVG